MPLIAVAQTNSGNNIQHNLQTAHTLIMDAARQGASAICLPECFALMQTSRQQLRQSAEVFGEGMIQNKLSSSAKQAGITVFAGTMPIQSDDPKRVYNCALVFAPDGTMIARYDKMYLFDVTLQPVGRGEGEQYFESAYTKAGDNIVSVETAIGWVGLTVCYDMRFPELYRALVRKNTQIFMVPSAFSATTGAAHWHTLLRARAIENFSYVIAAAQTGKHPSGRRTYGHSVVIDPWGAVVAENKSAVGLLLVAIDLEKVTSARRQIPSLEHMRDHIHPLSN